LVAADDDDDDEVGGAGYWKRLWVGLGLAGLKILRGSTVGLSQSSAGPGLLMKSSSSGMSRDRVAIFAVGLAMRPTECYQLSGKMQAGFRPKSYL
jgi:hypothetical protein